MNKQFFLLLSAVALIPGCGGSRSQRTGKRPVNKAEVLTDVDIPVADGNIKNFFDTDLDEMVPLAFEEDSDYAWIEQAGKGESQSGFKKVYFGFDKYNIESSEKQAVNHNIARMKQLLAQEEKSGQRVQFVVNGNADHFAGSDVYNHILSENRAKTLQDYAVAAGIPRDRIAIVGRGSDVPEIINGKPVTGNKDQQAPNRRDEIQMIASAA